MGTSIASQLESIKSLVQAEDEPLKRPFTRPSILFDPKEAADIDLDTILNIARSGLEALISFDERFRNYKSDIFSHSSKDVDRELMSVEENNKINASISSYLKLLSGHLQLPASLKTLEYLIRRYKIHVYNIEDLILCALPYHDTHAFVRIVQLLNLGNNKWKFLDGVKVSGASPSRAVIVQQCICDMGVLEALCNYASVTKKFVPSRPVISFCTAVVIEALGSVTVVDSDVVKRILPFVESGLRTKKSTDQKAGALMIVSLLASKAALAPKLVKSLMLSIAEIGREDVKESSDLHWFRLSLMTLVNLVQLQSIELFPKKTVDVLKETRDIAGLLLELSKEFNIDRFLAIFLESLIEYCSFDESCHLLLVSVIEKVPLKDLVDHVISRVFSLCMKLSQKDSASKQSGSWVKKILLVINTKYPSELHGAVRKFLEGTKRQSKKEESVFEILSNMLDKNVDVSANMPDSKIWFALHHPKAEVRRAILSGLQSSEALKVKVDDSQRLVTIQDAVLHQLRDDDLTVIQAALSIDGLPEIISSCDLLGELVGVLNRCLTILMSSSSENFTLAGDVAISCLKIAISSFHDLEDCRKKLLPMMFPLLLVLPKTQKTNLKVLELAKELKWPIFQNLASISRKEKKSEPGGIALINLEVVSSLAQTVVEHPEELVPLLVGSCGDYMLSKTLLHLILMQSLLMHSKGGPFATLFEACFSVLKTEWEAFECSADDSIEEFNAEMLSWGCNTFLEKLFETDLKALNKKLLICIFWRLLEAFISAVPANLLLDANEKWFGKLHHMFVFFANSRLKHVFKEHRFYLVTKCKVSLVQFLSRFFTEEDVSAAVQVESLHCFAFLCLQSDDRLLLELLAEFPAVLVPLASGNQDTRRAAMDCVEGLYALWRRVDFSSKKNGNTAIWSLFLDEILSLMVQQKRLILSDSNFLASFLTSLLGSTCHSLSVPQNIEQRSGDGVLEGIRRQIFGNSSLLFDQSTKDKILAFILGSALKFSAFGKLMILSLLKGLGSSILHVKDVKSYLSLLLERRSKYCSELNLSSQKLTKTEVKILCLLLESCATPSSFDAHEFRGHVLKALQVEHVSSEDPSVVEPCVTVLRKLSNDLYNGLTTDVQECLFRHLILLFRHANGDIQNATRNALLRIQITSSMVSQVLEPILEQKTLVVGSSHRKKKRRSAKHQKFDANCKGENAVSFVSSLLDVLLYKKGIVNRDSLLGPLFKLLGKVFSDGWLQSSVLAKDESGTQDSSGLCQNLSSTLVYIQQTTLIILQGISASLVNSIPLKDDVPNKINVKLLVDCARSVKDGVTRNHVFSLLSSITKVVPEKIMEHVMEILAIIGESTITQNDSHSQRVFEDLISAVLPCWLSQTDNKDKLLQVFVNVLPEVAEHRRLSIVVYVLRTLGEYDSLASLLVLLFHSLVSKKGLSYLDKTDASESLSSSVQGEWEYVFAVQICEQYSCTIWLPSLVALLQQLRIGILESNMFMELWFAINFVLHKLKDPEFAFKLGSKENSDNIQGKLEELMEQIVSLMQFIDGKRKELSIPVAIRRELTEHMHSALRTITVVMTPSTFFKGIINLLTSADGNARKKALGLLCETVKDVDSVKLNQRGKHNLHSSHRWLHMDESDFDSFRKMCLEIILLMDDSVESNMSLKLAAVSTLEVLASKFSSQYLIFNACLASVTKSISSPNLALSSSCLRTTGALINVLGPKALAELPHIMKNLLRRSREITTCTKVNMVGDDANLKESLMVSILVTLEAVIDKLGGFLNPYLGEITKLLVLSPGYVEGSDLKLKTKADVVRKLLTEKIPVRLAFPPLLNIYPDAVDAGDSTLVIAFNMLGDIIGRLDRSEVGGLHAKIFDQCMLALDLRRQNRVPIRNIDTVENSVIEAVIALTMKLTETMFRPLFVRSIEWAETDLEDTASIRRKNLDRAITFFGLVNKLAESHRSLFVPYFKYLLDACVRHLTDSGDVKPIRKKKKARIQEVGTDIKEQNSLLSIKQWQLRALVISSLHKCFLYDTGNLKFLDSSNSQLLLKPIVSQLTVEPPADFEEHSSVPSVEEVDNVLVVCIGQMAVAAGTDLLWKPLNHEVLMQTRSEKVRSRILGLRIVKYLLENLKEEYLVLLPETIPFLGELLEDVELPVKSLAQDILKDMEFMSGESLQQYL